MTRNDRQRAHTTRRRFTQFACCTHPNGLARVARRRARSCWGGARAGGYCARLFVRVLGASPALVSRRQRLHVARERDAQLLQPSAPQAPGGASAPLPCRTAVQVGANCVRSLAPPTGASLAPRGAPYAHHVARERGARAHTCAPSQPPPCATGRRQPTRHGCRCASRMSWIRVYSVRSRREGAIHAVIM